MSTDLPPPFDVLVEIARGDGIEIEDLPAEPCGYLLRPETWTSDAADLPIDRSSQDLPPAVAGVRMEGTPVLVGVVSGEPTLDAMKEWLRRYRNQATIARSWLNAEAANLQLFLAAPLGSAGDAGWQEIAALVEADDRVCRKLVWLPPAHSIRKSASDFLARTFLASPWTTTTQSNASQLDTMSTISLPEGWDEVVGDPSLDANSLVLRLLEARSK